MPTGIFTFSKYCFFSFFNSFFLLFSYLRSFQEQQLKYTPPHTPLTVPYKLLRKEILSKFKLCAHTILSTEREKCPLSPPEPPDHCLPLSWYRQARAPKPAGRGQLRGALDSASKELTCLPSCALRNPPDVVKAWQLQTVHPRRIGESGLGQHSGYTGHWCSSAPLTPCCADIQQMLQQMEWALGNLEGACSEGWFSTRAAKGGRVHFVI